jgi:hypothetical protein
MNVTIPLVSLVVVVGVALAWRLYRWRWRPRLEVDAAPRRDSDGPSDTPPVADAAPDWLLRVRNQGAATARRCRATLLRLQVDEDGTWRRFEPDPQACPMTWSDEPGERNLAPSEAAYLVVVRGNGLPPGRYRFEIAVINGEERRVAFELAVPGPDQLERNSSAK